MPSTLESNLIYLTWGRRSRVIDKSYTKLRWVRQLASDYKSFPITYGLIAHQKAHSPSLLELFRWKVLGKQLRDVAKTDGAGFASLSENSFILLFPFLLESCSYVNGFDNFCVGKRQADLSRPGSGHLIGDYRNHFLFTFLVRNQLRNAVGRAGISSLFPRSARISASCPHLWILKFENKNLQFCVPI